VTRLIETVIRNSAKVKIRLRFIDVFSFGEECKNGGFVSIDAALILSVDRPTLSASDKNSSNFGYATVTPFSYYCNVTHQTSPMMNGIAIGGPERGLSIAIEIPKQGPNGIYGGFPS
jgi:hypothetical protein